MLNSNISPLPRRVLVIDDNQDAAELLCEVLALLGHESRCAFDGPSGIKLAEKFHPDIIFLDIGMPGMSGFEVAIAMRKLPVLLHSRIIALTAWRDEATKKRAKECGFDSHLTKPAPLEVIRDLVAIAV